MNNQAPTTPAQQSSGKMTADDASRIQSTQDKGGKDMSKGGFAARAQSAGDKNTNANSGAGGQQK